MKLYRLRYSPYARKVQATLDLAGVPYEAIEVPYGDRNELAALTGGYIHVPVLIDDAGAVIVESRDICERIVSAPSGQRLVPSPLQGPIWGYADFCDGPLEDVLFRIASPEIRDAWSSPFERALYVLVKERKFGAGCVDAWKRERPQLLAKARRLLAPTLDTLERQPFLFGEEPTLADAALYGECAMLEEADPTLLRAVSEGLALYAARVAKACSASRAGRAK